jgi:O-antigen/teichoic acid export membrane protein
MLASPLRFLMPATLANLYDRGLKDRVRAYLRAALKYFLLLAIPASVGLALLSRDLLEVLTTDEIAREGYMVTPVVALAMLLYGTQVIITQVLLVEKRTRKIGGVMSTTAVLNMVLNLLLIPIVGIVGAALATLVSFAFSMLVTARLSFRYIRVEVDRGALAKTVAASAAMGTAIWALGLADLPGGLLGIVLVVLAGFAVFSGTTLLLGTLSRGELRFFWGLLRGGADGHRG